MINYTLLYKSAIMDWVFQEADYEIEIYMQKCYSMLLLGIKNSERGANKTGSGSGRCEAGLVTIKVLAIPWVFVTMH